MTGVPFKRTLIHQSARARSKDSGSGLPTLTSSALTTAEKTSRILAFLSTNSASRRRAPVASPMAYTVEALRANFGLRAGINDQAVFHHDVENF